MSYKDTLALFDELVASGTPEAQARIQAQQSGSLTEIVKKIENDLIWLRIIGAAMTVAFMTNGLANWFK